MTHIDIKGLRDQSPQIRLPVRIIPDAEKIKAIAQEMLDAYKRIKPSGGKNIYSLQDLRLALDQTPSQKIYDAYKAINGNGGKALPRFYTDGKDLGEELREAMIQIIDKES